MALPVYRDPTTTNSTSGISTLRIKSSEMALSSALVAIALVLGVVDCVGALLAHTGLVSLGSSATFLMHALQHPGAPASAWPEHQNQFSAFAFWSLAGMFLILPALLAVPVVRHRPHRDIPGFATRAELTRVATLEAAIRQAKVSNPSISVKSSPPDTFDHELGTTIAPRGVPLVASFEHSLQLMSPPGAGKTLRVLAPILLQHFSPVLATSTKPDPYETSITARQGFGPVFALGPDDLCPAAMPLRRSPIFGCTDGRIAERRAPAFVAAVGDGADVRGGGFFRRSTVTVLASYLHAAALSGSTMRDVVTWATRSHDPAPLRILSARSDGSIDWSARLHGHISGTAETTPGVMRTVDLALSCFSDPSVLAQSAPRDGEVFSFADFSAHCGTVFAHGKDRGALEGK